MKPIKKILLSLGLWYKFDKIRRRRAIQRWTKSGFSGAAPHPIKMEIVQSYLDRFRIDNFVETGTYLGDTLGFIARFHTQCTSIELSEDLYEAACKRFSAFSNVNLIHGDSAVRLPELLQSIKQPTLFWLDGHYSAGVTARGNVDTPISEELRAILEHSVKEHVILIDDARCFDGKAGYPFLDDLLRVIRKDIFYDVDVSTDIVRLVPRTKQSSSDRPIETTGKSTTV